MSSDDRYEPSGLEPSGPAEAQAQINAIRGSGQPLPEPVRAFFEPRFDHDFSDVRIHTDSRAVESAWAVNARAFTMGRDVVFGAGQYVPGTMEGKRLLAHELTHVVQQGYGPTRPTAQPLAVSDPAGSSERAAEEAADAVMGGRPTPKVASSPSWVMYRQAIVGFEGLEALMEQPYDSESLESESDVYRSLDPGERAEVNREVDQRYAVLRIRFGFPSELDSSNPAHLPFVRLWLRIRDAVIRGEPIEFVSVKPEPSDGATDQDWAAFHDAHETLIDALLDDADLVLNLTEVHEMWQFLRRTGASSVDPVDVLRSVLDIGIEHPVIRWAKESDLAAFSGFARRLDILEDLGLGIDVLEAVDEIAIALEQRELGPAAAAVYKLILQQYVGWADAIDAVQSLLVYMYPGLEGHRFWRWIRVLNPLELNGLTVDVIFTVIQAAYEGDFSFAKFDALVARMRRSGAQPFVELGEQLGDALDELAQLSAGEVWRIMLNDIEFRLWKRLKQIQPPQPWPEEGADLVPVE